MYCQSCGKEIPDKSAFCLHCGTRIDSPGTTSTRQEPARSAHFKLPQRLITKWRSILGDREGWSPSEGLNLGPKSSALIAKLDPPYKPGSEALVFFTYISPKWAGGPEFIPNEVTYKGVSVRKGWMFATESRLIYWSERQAFQIYYESMKKVNRIGDSCSLVLKDGSEVVIHMSSLTSAVLGLTFAVIEAFTRQPDEYQHILDRDERKEDRSERFMNDFTNFFREVLLEVFDEASRRSGA